MKKIVKFGASWCNPCKVLDNVLDKFKEKHPDVKIEHIDVDENVDLTAEHSVRNVPTCVFYDGDEQVGRVNGTFTATRAEEILKL